MTDLGRGFSLTVREPTVFRLRNAVDKLNAPSSTMLWAGLPQGIVITIGGALVATQHKSCRSALVPGFS